MMHRKWQLWIILSLLWFFACEQTEQGIPNHNPELISFGLLSSGVQAGGFATLFCAVSDPDNDSLSYHWTSPAGSFAGSGDTVFWRAPLEISRYPISCQVDDGQGGYIEVDFSVQVFPNLLFPENSWTIYNSSNTDLPPYSIDYLWSVQVDRFGQVWMGDHNGRLHKYDGERWQTWPIPAANSESLHSIDIDLNDHLWIILEVGVLVEFDGENSVSHHRSQIYANNVVIDQNNNPWVAFWNFSGPSKFDGSNWQDFSSSGLPCPMDIAIDALGDIWYIADSALVHYDHMSWTIIEGPVPQWKQSIAIDKENRIWVATETHELAMYDHVGWTYFRTPFEGNDGWINDLMIDEDNNIWCACDGGIAILDGNMTASVENNAWRTVITSDNSPIPDGWISALTLDLEGNVWGGVHAYGASAPGGGGLFKIDRFHD
jgi:hypothetical protein